MTTKEKIQELCPDVKRPDYMQEVTITLAIVLRAIEKRDAPSSDGEIDYSVYGNIFHIGKYADIGRNGYYSKGFWNLEHDNYDQQSEECKQFIGNLF